MSEVLTTDPREQAMSEPVYTIYDTEDGEQRCRAAVGPGGGSCPSCQGGGQVEYRGASHRDYDEPNYWDACGYCGGDGQDAPFVTADIPDGEELPQGFRWATREELDELVAARA